MSFKVACYILFIFVLLFILYVSRLGDLMMRQKGKIQIKSVNKINEMIVAISIQKKIYNIVFSLRIAEKVAKTQWEHGLGEEISVQAWGRTNGFNIKISMNIAIRENRYKIIHLWYMTPNYLECLLGGMSTNV